jgi:hypothetical protein
MARLGVAGMACHGRVRQSRRARWGGAWLVRHGTLWRGGHGKVGPGESWYGTVRQARKG